MFNINIKSKGVPVSELVYIHSKLLIADDKVGRWVSFKGTSLFKKKNDNWFKFSVYPSPFLNCKRKVLMPALKQDNCVFIFYVLCGDGKYFLSFMETSNVAICKVVLSGSTAAKRLSWILICLRDYVTWIQYQHNFILSFSWGAWFDETAS